MPDQPNDLPEIESGGTEPLRPPKIPSAYGSHVQQQPARRPEYAPRKRKPKDRSGSPLYLPAWSVGLMLLLVFGIVAATITLVMTLGGQTAPGGEPVIIIITAQPSSTPAPEATATVESVAPLPTFQGPLPTFGLEGPTLVPLILSPTPIAISVGATVIVNVDGLNVREAAGTGNDVVTFANEGDRYIVIGGPEGATNLTWWEIQSVDDPSITGWAAADYLDVAIQ